MRRFKRQTITIVIVATCYLPVSHFAWAQSDQADSLSDGNKFERQYPHVPGHEFNKGNVQSLDESIEGLLPGLWVSEVNGNPNRTGGLRLRGLTTLGTSVFERADPTTSFSGFKGLSFNDIDPFFIGEVSVVNDGSLASYGLQGALGAVELRPQQGSGKNQVVYHSFWSMENEIVRDPVLSATEFRRASNFDEGGTTDWRDAINQKGQSWVNQLSFSGAVKSFDYYVGMSHRDAKGIQRRTRLDQIGGLLNVGYQLLNNRLKLRGIGFHSKTDRDLGYASAYEYADRFNPTAPIRLSNQDYNQPARFGYFNPVAIVNENSRDLEEVRTLGLFKADLNFSNWTWGSQVGFYLKESTGSVSSTGLSTFQEDLLGASADHERQILSYQSQIQYQQQMGQVLLKTSAGLESQHFDRSNFTEFRYTFLTDTLFEKHRVNLLAYFGDIELTSGRLKGRVTYRREGSSAFSSGKRWNNYFSTTFRYLLPGLNSFSQFEVFTSFGTSGMTPFQSGMSKRLVQSFDFPQPPIFDQNDTENLGDLSSTHYDLGIMMFPHKGNWTATVNFFTNQSSGFWNRHYDPTTLDFNTWINSGKLRTTGLEMIANTQLKLGNINWSIRGVFSTQRTKIIDAGVLEGSNFSAPGFGCGSGTIHRIVSGDELGNFYGPKFVGFSFDQGTRSWILEDADGNGFPGDDGDYQLIGNALPNWTMGMQHQFTLNKFLLQMNFNGMFGHDIVNFRKLHAGPATDGFNLRTSRVESELQTVEESNQWSSYFVENGSFLRLQQITLQYQISLRATWLKELHIYVTGNNLITITGYDGNPGLQLANNPDQDYPIGGWQNINQWTPGIDRHDAWPDSRSITLGLNTRF